MARCLHAVLPPPALALHPPTLPSCPALLLQLTQECRKALTEVQCTNLTPEMIATLQSQLPADKVAEVIEAAKFGPAM